MQPFDAMTTALVRLEAGGSDGTRCGVPFVRTNGAYLFKFDGHLSAFLESIDVDMLFPETSTTVFDRNDRPHRPVFDARQGSLEIWNGKDAALLTWRIPSDVA